MNSEDAQILRVHSAWPTEWPCASTTALSLALAGAQQYPGSRRLHLMAGDLLVYTTEPPGRRNLQAKAHFETALSIDPDFAEAWESLAEYVEVQEKDLVGAMRLYERAIACRCGPFGYAGYARSMAGLGRRSEALARLDSAACPYFDAPEVISMRAEIAAGTWDP